MQEEHHILFSFIPNEDDYKKYQSQHSVFDFFSKQQSKDVNQIFRTFSEIKGSLPSSKCSFWVVEDFETAEKLGLNPTRKFNLKRYRKSLRC